MKLAALSLIVALSAGAASAQQPTDAQTFTGWVKVTNGELQLFDEQRQLDEPFARPCTSVVLPRELQRSSFDLAGARVAFTGRAVAWADRDHDQVMTFKGSRVANECRGQTVIQADAFRILRGR